MLNYEDKVNTITEYKLASLIEASASFVYKFLYEQRIPDRREIMKDVITCLNYWGKEMNCSYKINVFMYVDFDKNINVINMRTSKSLSSFLHAKRTYNAKQTMDSILLAATAVKENVPVNEKSKPYVRVAFKKILNHYGR